MFDISGQRRGQRHTTRKRADEAIDRRTAFEQSSLEKKLTGFWKRDVGRLIRYTSKEKQEIIQMVERSEMTIKQTLEGLDVRRSTIYSWFKSYQEKGGNSLKNKSSKIKQFWNRIPDTVREEIEDLALEHHEEAIRLITYYFFLAT